MDYLGIVAVLHAMPDVAVRTVEPNVIARARDIVSALGNTLYGKESVSGQLPTFQQPSLGLWILLRVKYKGRLLLCPFSIMAVRSLTAMQE